MKTGKKSVVAEILTSLTRYFAALVIIVAAAILLSGIRMVKSGEVALIFRFGKLTGETYEEQVHGPGLMFAFPYVIDEVVTVPVGSVKKTDVTTHYTSGTMSAYTRNGYVVSGDKNIIMISASVQYSITDPVLYVLNVNDESKLINGIVSAKLISAAAAMSSDSLLTTGKLELADTVKKASQNELNSAQTGITIASLELTNVSMPQEVREIYDAVNSAKVQAETMTEPAKQYRETVIPAAEATASSLVSGATADSATRTAAAESYLSEFRGILEEYENGGDAVRIRVYNEKISAILSKIGEIRFVGEGGTKIVIGGPDGKS